MPDNRGRTSSRKFLRISRKRSVAILSTIGKEELLIEMSDFVDLVQQSIDPCYGEEFYPINYLRIIRQTDL